MACTACGALGLEPFYRVDGIPIHSCRMMRTRDAALAFPRRDLELAFCPSCGFIQNRLFDPEAQDYALDYEDSQACSPRFAAWLRELVDRLIARHDLRGRTVLELGPGGGDFLALLAERGGCIGIGIGPSSRPERLPAAARGRVTLIQERLGPAHFALPADFVCCRHTLEHIAEPAAFVALVRTMLDDRPRVPVMFEVPDAARILAEGAFWDVYYEHCGYYTAGSLARLFRRLGFEVTSLDRVYENQYLTLEARTAPAPTRASLPIENDLALARAGVARFRTSVTRRLARLARDLDAWGAAGRRVVVWGASSKAVAYLAALDARDRVAAVVDINPAKRGRFLAGTGHAILHPDDLVTLRPDVAVLTNPIYTDEIRRDLAGRGLHPELVAL